MGLKRVMAGSPNCATATSELKTVSRNSGRSAEVTVEARSWIVPSPISVMIWMMEGGMSSCAANSWKSTGAEGAGPG